MRIWIDLTNSPHVNFFAAMIEELRKEHEVLLTCRPLANTIELLQLKNLEYHVVGSHYGKSIIKKMLGFAVRVLQLCSFLRGRQIDVAISHSSPQSSVVARLLGIRSVYLNDNEHAAANRLCFLCATTIMVPEFLSMDEVRRQWGSPSKVIHYPGVKEGIYLAGLRTARTPVGQAQGMEIFIRPEPWTAQYYRGAVNFLDDLIVDLKDRYRIVVLPRGEQQAAHYRQEKFAGIEVPGEALSLETILDRCLVFIGAGGTMTREAAVLGVPTVSVYQDELLAVDRYLIEQGWMVHCPEIDAAYVDDFVRRARHRPPNADLLDKGEAASHLILQVLLHGAGHGRMTGAPADEEKTIHEGATGGTD